MELRRYWASGCDKMAELFYQTVHCVNARDYTKEQLNAWASGTVDLEEWNRPFFEHRGYRVIREQTVIRKGIPLTNFVMEK